ncbi:MAG: hypothetical protein ABI992_08135, partial [Chthoniobacterales bacterium]
DDGAIGDDGDDGGGADLDGFLDDEVHVFPFGDGLAEGDLAAEGRGLALVKLAEGDLAGIDLGDLGGHFAAVPIEEDDFSAGLEAEDGAGVVRFGAGEEGGGRPIGSGEVEAVHFGESGK